MENGRKIKLMDMASTSILMAPSTMATGRTTYSMVMEKKSGQMDPLMRDITSKDRKMEKELTFGVMVLNTLESGSITK